MFKENLMFTASGIRGIAGKDLTDDVVKKIAIAYGSWLEESKKRVILGRDTRPSGKNIANAIIDGLLSTGCRVIDLKVCPTPIIIYAKNKLKIPAGIIISGSHNPPEWNGLKLFSAKTFLSNSELSEISNNLKTIDFTNYISNVSNRSLFVEELNPIPDYIQDLYNHVDYVKIKSQNKLKVALDTGAGAGKIATPQVLKGLGCKVTLINDEFDENNNFPRDQEPIEKNLSDLIETVIKEKCEVGFAHDCDADRLAIIGNDGTCYPEDVGLALITYHYLKQNENVDNKIIFVTNLASSLMFDDLAKNFNAEIVRTPVGERYLAEKMDDLIEQDQYALKNTLIFGGEGSCGGVMLPTFNNARDGIFAAAKIVEILVETNEKVSDLVKLLPKFYSVRTKIDVKNKNIELIMERLKKVLEAKKHDYTQIGLDLKIEHKNDWFVLIHPSNTEPIIRVISEARTKFQANNYCKKFSDLLELAATIDYQKNI